MRRVGGVGLVGGRGGNGRSSAAKTPAATPSAAPAAASPEALVLQRLNVIAGPNPNSATFVALESLRDLMPELSRSEFDSVIRRMSVGQNPVLFTVREANQKTLTRKDNEDGVSIGGEISTMTRIADW
jgi:hypothetical protein